MGEEEEDCVRRRVDDEETQRQFVYSSRLTHTDSLTNSLNLTFTIPLFLSSQIVIFTVSE